MINSIFNIFLYIIYKVSQKICQLKSIKLNKNCFEENNNPEPIKPGSPDVDPVQVYGSETKDVTVKIIGNSFYPKAVQVTEGTTVTWQNEDIFIYMECEFAGIHSAATYNAPVPFSSPLLGHAENIQIYL